MSQGGHGHPLRCMEIRGGSGVVETDVSTPGLDAWVYSKPFEGAARGGDVHYVSLCGGGAITRIIVADVSGHGEEVAEVAAALRAILRRNINRKSQTRLVGELNRQFAHLGDAQRFATAVVATYLATKDRLTICNAGHPRPLWYRASTREWAALTPASEGLAGNLPLGLDDASPYEQFAVNLGRGDLVLFHTDALIEAADRADRPLGEAGLLEIARGLDPNDPRSLGPALIRAVDAHRDGAPAEDDVTLLTLHHNAGPIPRLSVGEKLDVYAKVFGLKAV